MNDLNTAINRLKSPIQKSYEGQQNMSVPGQPITIKKKKKQSNEIMSTPTATPTQQYSEPIGPTKPMEAITSNTLSNQLANTETNRIPVGTTAQQAKTVNVGQYQNTVQVAPKKTFLQKQRAKGGATAFAAGIAQEFISTGVFAKELALNPVRTIKETGKGIYGTGKKIVTGEGFPEIKELINEEPAFFAGNVAGNVALFKAGTVISKVSKAAGYPKLKTTFLGEPNLISGADDVTSLKFVAQTQKKNLFTNENFLTAGISNAKPIADDIYKSATIGVTRKYVRKLPSGKNYFYKPEKIYASSVYKTESADLGILGQGEKFYGVGRTPNSKFITAGISGEIDDASFVLGKSQNYIIKDNKIKPLKYGKSQYLGRINKQPTSRPIDIFGSDGYQLTQKRLKTEPLLKFQTVTAIEQNILSKPSKQIPIINPKNLFSKQTGTSQVQTKTQKLAVNIKQDSILNIKPKQLDTELIGFNTKQISKTKSKSRQRSNVDSFLRLNQKENQISSLRLNQGLGFKQATATKQLLKTRTSMPKSPMADFNIPIVPFNNKLGLFDYGFKKGGKGRKGKTKYKPSLTAIGLNIKAFKVPNFYKKGLGGFGIRPLIVKKRRSKKRK